MQCITRRKINNFINTVQEITFLLAPVVHYHHPSHDTVALKMQFAVFFPYLLFHAAIQNELKDASWSTFFSSSLDYLSVNDIKQFATRHNLQ